MNIQEIAARVTGLEPKITALETSQAAITAENKTLKESLAAAEQKLTSFSTASADTTKLQQELATARIDLAAMKTRAEAAEAKSADYEVEIKAAKAELEKKPAEINRVATHLMTQGFSRLGLSAPISETANQPSTPRTLSRAEFDALSPSAKTSFLKTGGAVSDDPK